MSRPVLVIGAGVAGISACLHISEACPERPLSLISYHSEIEPSADHSKIVRVDYENGERMKEAQIAQKHWTLDPFFSSYYIPCGRIVAYNEDNQALDSIDQNRRQLGLALRSRQNKELLEEFFGQTHAPDTLVFVYNQDDAVINWQPCIVESERKAKEACFQTASLVYDTKVVLLEHQEQKVTAVTLANGSVLDTRNMDIVLAVGPWTVEVFEGSGIELPRKERVLSGFAVMQVKWINEF